MTSTTVPHQRPWPGCPSWCVVRHGVLVGEEDWVHVSAPTALGSQLLARLCATIDPRTGEVDGPYVLLGEQEHTLAEALALGEPVAGWVSRTAAPHPAST